MTTVAPFAYAADGEVYACGDGPELFCYSGVDDTAMWKQFCDGMLVGVGACPDAVHSLDDRGGYAVWDARSGANRIKVDIGQATHALFVSLYGSAGVITDQGITWVAPDGSTQPMPLPGVTAGAFSADGATAAVGTSTGDLVLVDPASGTQLAVAQVGGSIAAVAWSGQGEWVVATGNQLVFVAGEVALPPPQEGAPPPSPIRRTVQVQQGTPSLLAVNVDGVLVACDDGANNVLVYETNEYRCGGTIALQRPIGGLCFGPGTLLGIGLEYADANRVEVLSGATERSKPGLGKGNQPWFPRVQLDQYILRGAVATKRAGGMPIANVRTVQRGGGNRTLLFVGLGVGFFVLCCGGIGTALAVWRFVLT